MTHKDFEALAFGLRLARPDVEDFTTHSAVGNNTFTNHISFEAALAQWRQTVRHIGDACAASNGRFDRDRFERAADR